MIDIHCHILAGLDDGASTLEQSLALAKQAIEHGTTHLVATPHANRRYSYDPQQVEEKIKELEGLLQGELQLYRGCDFHLDADRISEACEQPWKYWIHQGPYILIEFDDYLPRRAAGEALLNLQEAGVVPIITHPERNGYFLSHPEELRRLVQWGCFVQVTALALLGGFGRRSLRFAHQAITEGLAHIVASDAHHPEHRPARLDLAYDEVRRRHGEKAAQLLFVENPSAVIHGGDLEEVIVQRHGFWRKLTFWR